MRMPAKTVAALALALFLCLCGTAFTFAPDSLLSLSDYETELDHLSAISANVSSDPNASLAAARELPSTWVVKAGDQIFRIDTDWVQGKLEEAGKYPTGNAVKELTARLAELKTDAQAFERTPPDVSTDHARLSAILARPEFRGVHGQTWADRFRDWLDRLIEKALDHLFGSSSIPVIGRVTVWIVLGLAVLALAYWIFKTLKRNARTETFIPKEMPISAKEWRKWMAESQAAAAAGNWREAIHLSYWAGISFLEQRGMWRPDKARTPREYLRLLSPSSEYSNALSTLTREFEVVWYGYKEADPESYSATLAHLEDLGCRLT